MSFNCQINGLTQGRNSLRNTMLVAVMLIASSAAGVLALTDGVAGEASAPLDLWTMGVGMLGGLALFLYGMEQMADALKALAADRLKIILKKLTSNRYIGAVTGAIVTAVIQSSSVTTVLWVGFIDRLAEFVMMVSPVAEGLSGAEKLAAETPRQVANAHSIFNVANTLIFLPFGALFARLVERLLPDREEEIDAVTGLAVEFKTKFIDNDLLTVPSIALEQARNEIIRVAALVKGLVDDVLPSFLENRPRAAELMLAREEEVKYLGKELEQYLIEISRRNLNLQQSEISAQYQDINSDLKHIGKIVRKDYTQLLRRKTASDMKFSLEEHDKLLKYNSVILENLAKAIEAFSEDSADLARDIIRTKPMVVRQLRDYRALRFELSKEGNGEAVASRDAHLDLADFLRRVYAYSEAIAFTMLEGYLDGRRDDRPEKKEPAMAAAV